MLLGEATILPADVVGRVVVVIDVLRAASTVATALTNGARAVYPFASVEETARRGGEMGRDAVRLAGERRMLRIDGFDFGNSPLEFSRDAVAGHTILCTTSNGTAALVATHGARSCFFTGFVNAGRTVDALVRGAADGHDITIICAGTDRHAALEDLVCAGRLVRQLVEQTADGISLSDGARIAMTVEAPYRESIAALQTDASHAVTLGAAGFRADVEYCLGVDTVPVLVTYKSNRLEVE